MSEWRDHAACRLGTPTDPEWWWPNPRTPVAHDTAAGRAMHICQEHCPVLFECRADALANPPRHPTVLGGVRYVETKPAGTRPAQYGGTPHRAGCPYCPAGGAGGNARRPPRPPSSTATRDGVLS